MPNIVIDIASEFTGKKGFDQANTSTNVLEKSVNKLGKRLISLYAAKKVIQFAGDTAKAFAADEAAAQRLSTVVGNLGLGFEDLRIRQFIDSLETTSSVLDDKLRPAMQALILQTGSFAKAQELLKLAIDVSAGSTIDLQTVANDLAQAYVGNTKGLKKYYLGLTQAELKASSFLDIQTKLNKQFSGANAYYLNTYAGQMDQLAVGADKAKEIIGKGLIDALQILGGEGGIQTIVDGMKKVASYAAKFMTSFSIGLRQFKDLVTLNFADLKEVSKIIDKLQRGPQQYGGVYGDLYKKQVAAAEKAAEKSALAKIKADKAAAAAKAKADKAAASNDLALKKAAATFDLQKIQIAAALKNTYDKDDRLRLLALQEIENENGAAALKYIEQLNILTKEQQTNKLNGINGITETELNSINTILMRDLEAIRISRMSEEDKADARKKAYDKYNDAISASGGLAEAQYYTEKTRAQLLAIAKIAALDDVSSAQTTLLNIAKIDQLDVIKIVQNAQASADNEKYAALESYIKLLKSIPQIPAITQAPSIGSGGTVSNGGGMGGNYTGDFTDYLPANPGQTAFRPAQPIQPININVAGSILDGNDFTQIVNDALLNSQRTGLAQNIAGSLTVTP